MKSTQRQGFTLIELLVVIVIIGILVAIAMPNYIRVRERAREAEVKNNAHSIQLSLERYATDSSGSNYPDFLLGGDWTDSYTVSDGFLKKEFGSISQAESNVPAPKRRGGYNFLQTDDQEGWFGDMLIVDGYLGDYPRNPFIRQNADPSKRRVTWYPTGGDSGQIERTVGGEDAALMVDAMGPPPSVDGSGTTPVVPGNQVAGDQNVYPPFQPKNTGGYGPSRAPLLDGITGLDCENDSGGDQEQVQPGNNRLMGNFYYYPRTGDDGYSMVVPNPYGAKGYHLSAFGAQFNLGNDVYDRLGEFPEQMRTIPYESNLILQRNSIWSSDSYNSLQTASDEEGVSTLCNPQTGGPDGRKDGVIVTMSSGVDTKVQQEVTGS